MAQLIMRLLQLFKQGKVSEEFIKEATRHAMKIKGRVDRDMLLKIWDDLL